jgi:NTE family protein
MWIKNNQEDMDFFNLHEEELKNPSDTLKREIRAINSKYFYSYIRKSELYNLTFEQFYFLTGVDFVVTGTNVTNHASLYFSKERTPDFPVADAVVISMNLPGIYPPVWNKAKVFQDQSQFYLRRKKIFEKKDNNNYEYRAYNKMYRGQYIDGGVMNNLPLHAFDHIEKKREEVIDTNIFKYYIDPRNPIRNTRFNNNVMGLRLTEVKRSRDGVVDKEDDFGLSILGKTLFAALYYSEDGKILSRTEKRACVDLLTYQLSTTNFAPKRGQVKTAVQEAYTSAYRFITKIRKSAPNRLSSMIEKWDE